MAVNIKKVPTPDGVTSRNSGYRIDPVPGGFQDVPIFQYPFVNGEIMEMRGWLEGFGGDAVNGFVEILLHEGMFTMKAELEIYYDYTQHNLSIILPMIEARVLGLAHRFPKSHFRLRITYKTEWVMGKKEPPADKD
jgi:hypothetical protein